MCFVPILFHSHSLIYSLPQKQQQQKKSDSESDIINNWVNHEEAERAAI